MRIPKSASQKIATYSVLGLLLGLLISSLLFLLEQNGMALQAQAASTEQVDNAHETSTVPVPEKETPTQKVERFFTSRNLESVNPTAAVRGNLSLAIGEHVVKFKSELPPLITVGKPKTAKPRPFIMVIPDQKAFLKLWKMIAPSVLSSEPVSMPKIDFSKDKAVFVMPYDPRGGGKPASFRSAAFHLKKQVLLLEFDETDILSANPYTGRVSVTSVFGNPWYLGVFSSDLLPKEPIVIIRDW